MKENSIEEDIEELKRLLYTNSLTQYGKRKLINYYEQQEKDYTRVLKDNEELRKNIEGWKKYCEEIEEEQIEMSNKNCELEFEVEKLQKENEELREGLKRRIKYCNELEEDLYENATNYVIPKSRIEDEIEKLNNQSNAEELENIMNRKNYTITELVQYILQNLLEGKI